MTFFLLFFFCKPSGLFTYFLSAGSTSLNLSWLNLVLNIMITYSQTVFEMHCHRSLTKGASVP